MLIHLQVVLHGLTFTVSGIIEIWVTKLIIVA